MRPKFTHGKCLWLGYEFCFTQVMEDKTEDDVPSSNMIPTTDNSQHSGQALGEAGGSQADIEEGLPPVIYPHQALPHPAAASLLTTI